MIKNDFIKDRIDDLKQVNRFFQVKKHFRNIKNSLFNSTSNIFDNIK